MDDRELAQHLQEIKQLITTLPEYIQQLMVELPETTHNQPKKTNKTIKHKPE